jgi:putative FmdB family regulatory protein
MPIYGYACSNCDYEFDVLQKISAPKLVDCPECGEATLKKQLSAPKFRLKGQGWYETDFKTGDKRNIAGEAAKTETTKPKDAEKPVKAADTKKTADSKAKSV